MTFCSVGFVEALDGVLFGGTIAHDVDTEHLLSGLTMAVEVPFPILGLVHVIVPCTGPPAVYLVPRDMPCAVDRSTSQISL